MIPECVNCKNLFTCTIKDKAKGEACVIFEERDKDKSEARKMIDILLFIPMELLELIGDKKVGDSE